MLRVEYSIDDLLLSWICSLESNKTRVEMLNLSSDWQSKFEVDIKSRSVYFAGKLMKSELSLVQVEKIVKHDPGRDELPGQVAKQVEIVARESDIQLAMNYRNAIHFTEQISRLGVKTGVKSFGFRELLQLHSLIAERLIPSNYLGVFRLSRKSELEGLLLGKDSETILPVEIPYQVDDLFTWLELDSVVNKHIVVLAAVVFFELLRIQTFDGYNILVAVLAMRLLLAWGGYIPKSVFGMEEYIFENTEKLKMIVERGEDELATVEKLKYVFEGLSKNMNDYRQKMERLCQDLGVGKSFETKVALSERQIALVEMLQLRGEMTMTEARQVLPQVSDDTILRDLKELVAKKLIKKKGRTKGARYVFRQ